MKKFYFTFGQSHTHRYDGVTLDCDSVVEIEAPTVGQARDKMFECFGAKWSMQYSFETMNFYYFPRGVVLTLKVEDIA